MPDLSPMQTRRIEPYSAGAPRGMNGQSSAAWLGERLRLGVRTAIRLILAAGGDATRLARVRPLFDFEWYRSEHPDAPADPDVALAHFLAEGGFRGERPNPVFDSTFYLREYPDVRLSGMNPLEHFARRGALEKRRPSAEFDLAWYLDTYPDVARSGLNPVVHWLRVGRRERRPTKPLAGNASALVSGPRGAPPPLDVVLFDSTWYLDRNPAVRASGLEARRHFFEVGAAEGRNPHPLFDVRWYLARNPDVAAARANPLVHFASSGDAELRSPHPLFDPQWYLQRYPDVRSHGIAPFRHFLEFGAAERRSPHPLFDVEWYLAQASGIPEAKNFLLHYVTEGAKSALSPNPAFDPEWYAASGADLSKHDGDPFASFVAEGDALGRSPHALFDPQYYLNGNPDVGAVGIPPFRHYWTIGAAQGRNPHPMFDVEYYGWFNPEVRGPSRNALAHYLSASRERRRHPHPLFDGACHALTSARARDAQVDPLIDYVKFRSNLDPGLVARHATGIPTPRRAHLPLRGVPPVFTQRPLVSILLPTYESDERCLQQAIDSVRAQTYEDWEILLVDDGSRSPVPAAIATRFAAQDRRIRTKARPRNGGISEATNAALALSRGELVALLDHDDVLVPHALERVVAAMQYVRADVAYTDQSYVSALGEWESAFHKPAWSPALFTGVMYVGHLLVVKRSVVEAAGGFDSTFDGVQDFEFMLRVGERTDRIVHVPEMLYHWRKIPGSIAADSAAKGRIEPLQAAAVNAHFARTRFPAKAEPHPRLAHRLVIAPSLETRPAIDLFVRADGRTHTVAAAVATLQRLLAPKDRVITVGESTRTPGRLPLAELEALVHKANGEILVFVDPIVECSGAEWFEKLVMYLQASDVALAAPHVVSFDGRVLAAGLVASVSRGLSPAMAGLAADEDGGLGFLSCDREVSAVHGAVCAISRRTLERLGGFDRSFAELLYGFGDLALRARARGMRNIAVAGRGCRAEPGSFVAWGANDVDARLFLEKHADLLGRGDPYFNVNFEEPGVFTA